MRTMRHEEQARPENEHFDADTLRMFRQQGLGLAEYVCAVSAMRRLQRLMRGVGVGQDFEGVYHRPAAYGARRPVWLRATVARPGVAAGLGDRARPFEGRQFPEFQAISTST